LAKPITYALKMTFHLESLIAARMRETTPAKPALHAKDEDNSWMGSTKWASHGKCILASHSLKNASEAPVYSTSSFFLFISCDDSYLAEDTTVRCRTEHNEVNGEFLW
jgi:hypothetical protein